MERIPSRGRSILGLQAKLTLFAALLVLGAVSLTGLVAWQLLDQVTEAAARARLDHAAEVVVAEHATLLSNARITAEAIAAWPGADRSAGPPDSLTSVSRLIERSPFLRAAFQTRAADRIAVVAPEGAALVAIERGDSARREAAARAAPAVARALDGEPVAGLVASDEGIDAVVALPLRAGEAILGAVLVVSYLDDALTDRLKAATAFDVGFYANGRATASSMRLADGAYPSSGWEPAVIAEQVARGASVEDVRRGAGGRRVITRYYPLTGVDGELIGMFSVSAPVAVLFEARTNTLAVLALAVASVLAVALLTAIYMAQALSRPLRKLVEAVRRIGEGDLASPVYDGEKDEVGLLACATEELRLRLLKHAEEQAQLDRLKDQYLFSVAHELKTPLASLAASVELLAEDDGAASVADRRHLVRVVQRSTARFQMLVDNLLDLGSLRAGRFNVSIRPVVLQDVVSDAVAAVQPLMEVRGQHVEPCLPAEPLVVLGDARRLQQVLVNLLANATKFGPAGDTIDLDVTTRDGRARARIVDHGPGIAPAEQAELFEPYFRSATTREITPGVGLGLAIARAIVEAHGGQIGLDSVPGRGTTVWFTVPLADVGSEAPRPTTPAPAVLVGATRGQEVHP
jgi:signal transduction histidine kinase